MATLVANFDTYSHQWTGVTRWDGDNYLIAAEWVEASETITLEEVRTWSRRQGDVGTGGNECWIEVWDDDGSGNPGSIITNGESDRLTANTLPEGTAAEVTFTWTDKPTLTSGNKYFFVLTGNWTLAAYTGVWWQGAETNDADFDVWKQETGSWAETSGQTFYIQIYKEDSASTELVVADCAHAHAADAPTLEVSGQLVVADCAHAHAADAPTLEVSGQLVVADCAHAHAADAPVLETPALLVVADASHAVTSDGTGGGDGLWDLGAYVYPAGGGGLTLEVNHVLAVADADHTHVADNPTLVGSVTLVVAAADHGHAADAPLLVQAHTLTVAAADHSHVTDAPTLTQAHALAAAAADHAHAADAPVLVQANALAVADASHAHAADAPAPSTHTFLRLPYNYLLNPGLEIAGSGAADDLVAEWTEQGSESGLMTYNPNFGAFGNHSVTLYTYNPGDYCRILQTVSNPDTGLDTLHELSFWSYGTAGVIYEVYDVTNAAVLASGTGSTGASSWRQDSVFWTTPASCEEIRVTLERTYPGYPSLDEITLRRPNHHVHSADAPVLTQAHALVVAEASHVHAADAPVLVMAGSLVVQESGHAHAADAPVLTQAHELVVADATHAHAADSPDLSEHQAVVVAAADHAHAADALTLGQAHTLGVADADHAHAADNLVLGETGLLVVADGTHAHAADAPAIAQTHVLVVAAAGHSHASDEPAVTAGAESVELVVLGDLIAHAVDGVVLMQRHTLVLADGVSGHTADEPLLSVGGLIVIQDAGHAHAADAPTLTQAHVLAVQDATHGHRADKQRWGRGTGNVMASVVSRRAPRRH